LWAAQAAHKAAKKAVRTAGAAIAAGAGAGAAAAAGAGATVPTGNGGVSLSPQETPEARKRAAELQLEDAEEQLQLASIWVLSSDNELCVLFDLPHQEMSQFKAFAM
jgi:hypothetical protein